MNILLDGIRRRNRERSLERRVLYFQLVRKLATPDGEVDLDELAKVLDELGISEQQLEQDIETQKRRFVLAEQLEKKRKLEKKLPRLEKEFQHANEKYQTELARIKSELETVSRPFEDVTSELARYVSVEQELEASILNPRLGARREELLQREQELIAERNPLATDLDDCKRQLDELCRTHLIHRNNRQLREIWAGRKIGLEKMMRDFESGAQQLARPIEQIDAELETIRTELEKLNEEAFVP